MPQSNPCPIADTIRFIFATLASFGAGLLTGFLTGILYTKGKIPVLLAGILVMTGIYSINLRVLGKATVGLLNQNTLLNTGMLRELPNSFPSDETIEDTTEDNSD